MNIFKMKRYSKPFIKKQKADSGANIITRRVLAASIISYLEENGFQRCQRLETNYGDNSEIVYAKPFLPGSRRIITVYTSCNQVGGAYIAKPMGRDAIRVAGIYINKEGHSHGIIKNQRVNRTGLDNDIVKRLNERIIKTTKLLGSTNCCEKCGAPTFLSKNNNLVCADLCWRQK